MGGQGLIDITQHGGDGLQLVESRREGAKVNSSTPHRINNLLFEGLSQKNSLSPWGSVRHSLVFCFLFFFICSLILSGSMWFVCFTNTTLFFHPPHLLLSRLSPSTHPTPPSDLSLCVTQGFLFPFSPRFTCSPPASLTRCFIGEKLYLVEAGKGWSFCVLEVSLVSRHTGILMAIGWLDIAFCEHVHLSFFLFSSP